jgi:hypothetical protein
LLKLAWVRGQVESVEEITGHKQELNHDIPEFEVWPGIVSVGRVERGHLRREQDLLLEEDDALLPVLELPQMASIRGVNASWRRTAWRSSRETPSI